MSTSTYLSANETDTLQKKTRLKKKKVHGLWQPQCTARDDTLVNMIYTQLRMLDTRLFYVTMYTRFG